MLPRPAWTIRNATIFARACCMASREPMVFGAEVAIESSGGERGQSMFADPEF